MRAMDEGKRNIAGPPDPALAAAAEEELRHACTLGWDALARVAPWGDSYDGFASGGLPVTFERNYIWADEVGGDILVEVFVYLGPSRYDAGARASRLVRRP
jgi:hypothetical protein